MGGLDFMKKKDKKKEYALPPPPPPSPLKLGEVGDIEPIRPSKAEVDFSEFEVEKSKTGAPIVHEFEEKFVEKREPIEVKFPKEPIEVSSELKDKGGFFVSLNDYDKIERDVKSVETLIDEAEDSLRFLSETISEEGKLFNKWRLFLEGVEKKLTFVDKIIAKAGE